MATKYSDKQIQEMLAGLSVDQLRQAAKNRQLAELEPMKAEYVTTEKRLAELVEQIQAIDPTWEPPKSPTVSERIVNFLAEQKTAQTKAEIIAGVGTKFVGPALKKLVVNKTVTEKDGKYSAVNS